MSAWQPLLDRLTLLKDSWPGSPWMWDGRFSAIASTFTADQEPLVRASAVHAFPRGWTAKSLETAPPEFRAIAERTGGLRAAQRLLGGDPTSCPTLYGLWWPWGGGAKATLRIALIDVVGTADPLPQIRALFGSTT